MRNDKPQALFGGMEQIAAGAYFLEKLGTKRKLSSPLTLYEEIFL
jgi:hypothetical protein